MEGASSPSGAFTFLLAAMSREVGRYPTFAVRWDPVPRLDRLYGHELPAPYHMRFVLARGELLVSPLADTPAVAYDAREVLALAERAIREHPGWWASLGIVAPTEFSEGGSRFWRTYPRNSPILSVPPPHVLAEYARYLTELAPEDVAPVVSCMLSALPLPLYPAPLVPPATKGAVQLPEPLSDRWVATTDAPAADVPRRRIPLWMTVRECDVLEGWTDAMGPARLGDHEAAYVEQHVLPLAQTWCRVYAAAAEALADPTLVALTVAALCGISNDDEKTYAAYANRTPAEYKRAFDVAARVIAERS